MHPLAAAASCLVLLACGGKMEREEVDGMAPLLGAPVAIAPVGSAAVPSLATHEGGGSPLGQCAACAANSDCGNSGACVMEGDAGGGYCATGCTKEGFCLPGQVCKWVSDPLGTTWRACLPRAGCALRK